MTERETSYSPHLGQARLTTSALVSIVFAWAPQTRQFMPRSACEAPKLRTACPACALQRRTDASCSKLWRRQADKQSPGPRGRQPCGSVRAGAARGPVWTAPHLASQRRLERRRSGRCRSARPHYRRIVWIGNDLVEKPTDNRQVLPFVVRTADAVPGRSAGRWPPRTLPLPRWGR